MSGVVVRIVTRGDALKQGEGHKVLGFLTVAECRLNERGNCK